MAKSYFSEAKIRYKTARSARRKKKFAFTVRQSQECVELYLKGVLRYVGIESPKWHDVGIIIKTEIDRFPDWFKKRVDELAQISKELRRERELSMYGDSDSKLPTNKLYSKSEANEAYKKAKLVATLCQQLQNQIFKEK